MHLRAQCCLKKEMLFLWILIQLLHPSLALCCFLEDNAATLGQSPASSVMPLAPVALQRNAVLMVNGHARYRMGMYFAVVFTQIVVSAVLVKTNAVILTKNLANMGTQSASMALGAVTLESGVALPLVAHTLVAL
jgi:hypothetical protein